MSAFSECVGETVKAFIPNDLGTWLLAILIACIATGIVGGIATGGAALPVIAVGCAALIGISFVGPGLLGLCAGLLKCLPKI